MFFNGISTMLLNGQIQKDPWIVTDALSSFFGFFMNLIYGFISAIGESGALGFSIIILTIFVRLLMLPMAMKQQKSMAKMQALTPEIEKIKAKYGDTKDPELAQKMNREVQGLYSKHGVNPFAGCLPMFIQLPMFIALNYVMNQPYLFIDKIGTMYDNIANTIMEIPDYVAEGSVFRNLAFEKLPSGMELNLRVSEDIQKVLNKLTSAEWDMIINDAPTEIATSLSDTLIQLQDIEFFFGVDLTAACGWALPGIIIPILAAGTTFLSTYLSMKRQPANSSNPSAQATQKTMMYFMPIFMGFITVGLTAGVGLYWITSNIFQIGQQIVINKSMDKENIYETSR